MSLPKHGHFRNRMWRHDENKKWNAGVAGTNRKVKTKLKRIKASLPGTPQGKHVANYPDCRCGSCSRGFAALKR